MALEERFKTKFKVNSETGCWEWIASKNRKGYGMIAICKPRGKSVVAHRISYELYKGSIPPGVIVCHSCDNPSCVNPEHLFLGTHAMNVGDRESKGRGAKGQSHGRALLTELQVNVIREAYANGYKQSDIRRYFNVSHKTVGSIVHYINWRHI